MDNIVEYIRIAAEIVGAFSFFAALVPNPQVRAGLIVARKLLDLAAMNWGEAENKRATDKKPLRGMFK